ncbi:MAG: hypothetical protein KJO79_05820 [Verrucomicrobiae bacterium]|nr:hypothetical protein [Verrucomicrobiae bacterium]NNJ86681.1 hypothetical protein [Akkermansiaceae bacterium]
MNHLNIKSIVRSLLLALPLALPIAGIIHLDGKILADGELIDPVEIYKSHPMCMKFVHWSLVIALITAFTPFKRVSSLAAGIAIGSFLFYGVDLYSQLKDLSGMGLSKQPLIEMVEISSHGKWLIGMCILCAVTQIIYGILVPLARLTKNKPPMTDDQKNAASTAAGDI